MTAFEASIRVGYCLRAMEKQPSALLFVDGVQGTEWWTYDLQDLFGIPVYHVHDISDYYWGRQPEDCPFIPIGKRDDEITPSDRKKFADAW